MRGRLNSIIAKILTVGAAFSRDSRLQGACAHWGIYALQGTPAKRYQKFTSAEFQKQHQIVIASFHYLSQPAWKCTEDNCENNADTRDHLDAGLAR
jgi:hypothetical protein